MNSFLATVIGSSVISSIISSSSSNSNNKYSNKFNAKFNIKLKRIDNIRNNLAKYMSICLKTQNELANDNIKNYYESYEEIVFLCNNLISLLGVPRTASIKKIDLANFIEAVENKDCCLNDNNENIFQIFKDKNSLELSSFASRTKLTSILMASYVLYSDKRTILKHRLACAKMLNTFRDGLGVYLRKQEDELIKEEQNNLQKMQYLLKKTYAKYYIKSSKAWKFIYSVFIVIPVIYLLLLPWIKNLWNIDYINKYFSVFLMIIIINLIYYFYKEHKKDS